MSEHYALYHRISLKGLLQALQYINSISRRCVSGFSAVLLVREARVFDLNHKWRRSATVIGFELE